MKRLIVAITLLLVVGTAGAAQALAPLRLGVLAYRPKPQEMLQWQPLATYLESALAHPVALTLYSHAELDAAVSIEAFGGYQMQAFEFLESGLRLPIGDQLLITGLPHDQVIKIVLAGQVDAGFVRAGVLESLSQRGKLDFGQEKIINLQNLPSYPYALSTRLYPEWPVAVLPQVDKP